MAKARSVEARLARLRELRGQPASPQLLAELRSSLCDQSNLVVAEAAEIGGAAQGSDLAADLVGAFDRFCDDSGKKDKVCRAKLAIVEALEKLDFEDEDFYLRGARYVQLEPVWGGTSDTAVPVRVACAFALVRLRYCDVLPLLIDMLVDPDKAARVGAVQALTYSGTETAALLLRLKVRLGDEQPEVISECFDGILAASREQGMSFVAEYAAAADEAIRQAALLSLGNSRQAAAFEILKSAAQSNLGETQQVAHLALALLRVQQATDYLLAVTAGESAAAAASAVAALAIHRHDPRMRELVAAAVTKNGDPFVRDEFDQRFLG